MKKTGLMDALAAVKPAPGETAPARARRGKKTDPTYTQICMLVPKEDYLEVRRRLIGRDLDASDLVGSLLREWLEKDSAAKAPAPRRRGEK